MRIGFLSPPTPLFYRLVRNEVTAELTWALENTSHRIDMGFSIGIGALPPAAPADADADADDATPTTAEFYDAIAEISPKLEYMRIEGDPVLTLGSGDDDEEDAEPAA